MDLLCTNLIDTYNTNYLDKANNVTQAVFLNESEKYLSSKSTSNVKGRQTLMKLILNHYQKQKPSPDLIGGPRTLTLHWSKKYQMMVYTFGEYHSDIMDCSKIINEKELKEKLRGNCKKGEIYNNKTKRCLKATGKEGKKIIEQNKPEMESMESFLYNLIKTTDVFMDIYFEVPAYSGQQWKNHHSLLQEGLRLERLLSRFEKCIQYKSRHDEECQLSRMHYIDVRKENRVGINDVSKFRGLIQNIWTWPENVRIELIQEQVMNNPYMLNIVRELSGPDFEKFWIKQIDQNRYVQKELDRSPLKDKILSFIKKMTIEDARKHHSDLKYFSKCILGERKCSSHVLQDHVEYFYNHTVSTNARTIDAYTLARMFKNFNIDRPSQPFDSSNDQPISPHNIIIYAGDAHSVTYRRFLEEELDFKLLAKNKPNYDADYCLNMDGIPQPLFSNIPSE